MATAHRKSFTNPPRRENPQSQRRTVRTRKDGRVKTGRRLEENLCDAARAAAVGMTLAKVVGESPKVIAFPAEAIS